MAYGIRFYTYSKGLGSACDFYVPQADMVSAPNSRGFLIGRDILTTPRGNDYLYDKFKKKEWNLLFEDVTTLTKSFIEHIAYGWLGSQQITVAFFGTSVIGTVETPGSMAAAGQLFGTGYLTFDKKPQETALDLWTFNVTFTEFGQDQQFLP